MGCIPHGELFMPVATPHLANDRHACMQANAHLHPYGILRRKPGVIQGLQGLDNGQAGIYRTGYRIFMGRGPSKVASKPSPRYCAT
jgi:hypothetical protein